MSFLTKESCLTSKNLNSEMSSNQNLNNYSGQKNYCSTIKSEHIHEKAMISNNSSKKNFSFLAEFEKKTHNFTFGNLNIIFFLKVKLYIILFFDFNDLYKRN